MASAWATLTSLSARARVCEAYSSASARTLAILRLHLGLGDRDVGVALRLDLLQLGLLLVDQALLAVLLRELHRHLLVLQGLLVAVGVAEVAEQELLHLEAALLEALA